MDCIKLSAFAKWSSRSNLCMMAVPHGIKMPAPAIICLFFLLLFC